MTLIHPSLLSSRFQGDQALGTLTSLGNSTRSVERLLDHCRKHRPEDPPDPPPLAITSSSPSSSGKDRLEDDEYDRLMEQLDSWNVEPERRRQGNRQQPGWPALQKEIGAAGGRKRHNNPNLQRLQESADRVAEASGGPYIQLTGEKSDAAKMKELLARNPPPVDEDDRPSPADTLRAVASGGGSSDGGTDGSQRTPVAEPERARVAEPPQPPSSPERPAAPPTLPSMPDELPSDSPGGGGLVASMDSISSYLFGVGLRDLPSVPLAFASWAMGSEQTPQTAEPYAYADPSLEPPDTPFGLGAGGGGDGSVESFTTVPGVHRATKHSDGTFTVVDESGNVVDQGHGRIMPKVRGG